MRKRSVHHSHHFHNEADEKQSVADARLTGISSESERTLAVNGEAERMKSNSEDDDRLIYSRGSGMGNPTTESGISHLMLPTPTWPINIEKIREIGKRDDAENEVLETLEGASTSPLESRLRTIANGEASGSTANGQNVYFKRYRLLL